MDALHEFDRTADDTKIHHREATRFVSASQWGAGPRGHALRVGLPVGGRDMAGGCP